jgi:DNA segregation ATPase FtsK/SpoIIIE-like protein
MGREGKWNAAIVFSPHAGPETSDTTKIRNNEVPSYRMKSLELLKQDKRQSPHRTFIYIAIIIDELADLAMTVTQEMRDDYETLPRWRAQLASI